MTLTQFLRARFTEDIKHCKLMKAAGERLAAEKSFTEKDILGLLSVAISDPDVLDEMARVTRSGVSAPTELARLITDFEAKLAILEWHDKWPVLITAPPEVDTGVRVSGSSFEEMTMRVSQQIAWTTQQEYVKRFGSDPPVAPVLALLALPYAAHPDYREEWRP